MEQRVLDKLEFEKITERLAALTSFVGSEEIAVNLTPEHDADLTVSLLAETTEGCELLRLYPMFSIGGIRDIRTSLRQVEIGGVLNAEQLLQIGDSCRAIRQTKVFLSEAKGNMPRLCSLGRSLGIFKTIETAIEKTVLPDGSISDESSERLSQIRRRIRASNDKIKERLRAITSSPTKQKYLQEPIITIRNNRYVIPVKLEYKANIEGVVHDTSASGATLFVEPMSVLEQNNDIQRLIREEEEEILAILRSLSLLVNGFADDILLSFNSMAEIDFIVAKARLSYEMKASPPRINERGFINLIAARHPLIPADMVVPINLKIDRSISTFVITGPNTGGKTVTLKTMGIFVLMAQSGLHLPAEFGSEISVFKTVFADIGDEQSIEQSLSTFSSHMVNIVDILKRADSHSLVLLDELGAGTDPAEGAALAMAILSSLKRRESKVLATTHYSELKAYAYNNLGCQNAGMEFDLETLSPTYHLLIGLPGKSKAFEIARRLGMENSIIEEAASFMNADDAQVADLLANLEMMRREYALEQERLSAQAESLRDKEQSLREEEQRIKAVETEIIRDAHETSRRLIADTRLKSEELYQQIQQKFAEEAESRRALQEARQKLKTWQEQLEEKQPEAVYVGLPPKELTIGQSVFIPKFNQQGTVIKLADRDGKVYIQAGVIKTYLHIDELRPAPKEQATQRKYAGAMLGKQKSMSIKSEIDLRGRDAASAIEETDKYLDDAYIAGLRVVRIIHGKGMGILRKSIDDLLKSNRIVKSHRMAESNEGGTGVTIVELDL